MELWLRCQRSQLLALPSGKQWRLEVEISGGKGEVGVSAEYEYMCAALSMLQLRHIEVILEEIREVENGTRDSGGLGLDAWTVMFDRTGARFSCEYLNEGEPGGAVTLRQLKIAVQEYANFLKDPSCTPVEVPFPNA